MVLWTVDSFEIQKLCLLVGLVSASLGFLLGSHTPAEVEAGIKKFLDGSTTENEQEA